MFTDFLKSILNFERWSTLAWFEIKGKYRRSAIGPWWIVIINLISIGSLGAIGSALFNLKFFDFIPLVASGMLAWTLLATIVNESTMIFPMYGHVIQNLNVNLFDVILQSVFKNFIIFLHNLLAVVALLLVCSVPINLNTLMFIPAVLIIFLNATFVIIILGFLATRFRDVAQLVTTTMTIVFFVTPVMWDKAMIHKYKFIVYLNPFAHFIELMRAPLLGNPVEIDHYIYAFAFTIILATLANFIYKRYSLRLVYWL